MFNVVYENIRKTLGQAIQAAKENRINEARMYYKTAGKLVDSGMRGDPAYGSMMALCNEGARTGAVLSFPAEFAPIVPGKPVPKGRNTLTSQKQDVKKQSAAQNTTEGEEVTLEEAMAELNELIGLKAVKDQVKHWTDETYERKQRELAGLAVVPMTNHLVFTGNPGTGKTTVARIIGKICKAIGLVSKGQLVEVTGKDLIAGYVGQTGTKTAEVLESAIGGVLFLDEAYQVGAKGTKDFGEEAVATLLTYMENNRDDLVVITAGYASEMPKFIEINPGLPSRFKTVIDFPDYDGAEMMQIFKSLCKKFDYVLDPLAEPGLQKKLTDIYIHRDKKFANGRTVRNIFENAVREQSSRLQRERKAGKPVGRDEMMFLKKEDIEKALAKKDN